jgi:hypothetical protein
VVVIFTTITVSYATGTGLSKESVIVVEVYENLSNYLGPNTRLAGQQGEEGD